MGIVEAVCTSREKGTVKRVVDSAMLVAAWGIEGDAHAGEWHRQVSLLAGESIDLVRQQLPGLDFGMFGENLVTRGIDLAALSPGDRLQLGSSALLEVTQLGKVCHNGACPIKSATGDCIMPREGVFCRVLSGGVVRPGVQIEAGKADSVDAT